MSIAETCVILLLSAWLLLNTSYAIFNRQIARFTNRWDLFRWISAYQLFSISVARYRLSYQIRENAEWTEVPLFIPWKWHHMIWFPDMMLNMKLNSVIDELARLSTTSPERVVQGKIENRFIYKAIINYLDSLSAHNKPVQFKIEQVIGLPGEETYKELFISALRHL